MHSTDYRYRYSIDRFDQYSNLTTELRMALAVSLACFLSRTAAVRSSREFQRVGAAANDHVLSIIIDE